MPDLIHREAELIQRILEGDRELYHELVLPYERLVYLTACSLLKNEAEAEDAAQEAILKAFRGLRTFRGSSKFSTWLVSIVLNEARARLRKKERILTKAYEDQADISPALLTDWREIPSEALERRELIEHIERAIHELPFIYREVFVLRDRDELRIEEIATLLEITENLAKVRLHRARMMLQKILAPYLKNAISQRRRFPLSGGAM